MIRITSQRGGVGKTTLAVNLAVALGLQNYKVLLVDSDVVSPTVSFCMGLDGANMGVRDVMANAVELKNAVIRHDASGIDVLPARHRVKKFPTKTQIISFVKKIRKVGDYDFIIVDTPPGFYYPKVAKLYNEAIIVTTPTMSSITSAIRLANLYAKNAIRYHFVINKVTRRGYEITAQEIEGALGEKAIGILPDDPKVPLAEASHIPVYIMYHQTPFSSSMIDLARFYKMQGGGVTEESVSGMGSEFWLISFLKGLFGKISSKISKRPLYT